VVVAHRGIIAGLAVLVIPQALIFRVERELTPQDDQSEFDVSPRAPRE
jgi:hypothetical protein